MGKTLKFKIDIKNNMDTNSFLRCLWAELGGEKERGWQYSPYKMKENNKIIFGRFSSDLLSSAYNISMTYKKKGCVDTIFFESLNGVEISESDIKTITLSIELAKKFENRLKYKYLSISAYTYNLDIKPYLTENFRITTSSVKYKEDSAEVDFENILYYQKKKIHMNISIKASGYDDNDIESRVIQKIYSIIDVLSVELNCPIFINKEYINISFVENEDSNIYSTSNWIDDRPYDNGKALISRSAIKICELIVNDNVDNKTEKYLKSCKFYNSARKYYHFAYSNQELMLNDLSLEELTNSLFMSSLEIISTVFEFDPKVCKNCGQKIYSIRRRVLWLVEEYGFNGNYCRKIVDEYYNKRSSFLHEGRLFSNNSYRSISIPMIDHNSNPIYQMPVTHVHLISDSVSYILRELLYRNNGGFNIA